MNNNYLKDIADAVCTLSDLKLLSESINNKVVYFMLLIKLILFQTIN